MDVFIRQTNDEFDISIALGVAKESVLFSQCDDDPGTEASDEVVIISDF